MGIFSGRAVHFAEIRPMGIHQIFKGIFLDQQAHNITLLPGQPKKGSDKRQFVFVKLQYVCATKGGFYHFTRIIVLTDVYQKEAYPIRFHLWL